MTIGLSDFYFSEQDTITYTVIPNMMRMTKTSQANVARQDGDGDQK